MRLRTLFVLVVFVLLPSAALAADADSASLPAFDAALAPLLQAIAALAMAALTAGLAFATQWLRRKSGSTLVGEAVGRLSLAVRVAVGQVYQTFVQALKEANADGKLTPEEREEAMNRALRSAKGLLGLDGLSLLAKAFGIGSDAGAVDAFLVPHVEATIAEVRSFPNAVAKMSPKLPPDPSPASPQA